MCAWPSEVGTTRAIRAALSTGQAPSGTGYDPADNAQCLRSAQLRAEVCGAQDGPRSLVQPFDVLQGTTRANREIGREDGV